jgi:hypothetical protein
MNIVISYRRSDSEVIAGRIRDRLAARFGDSSVFMDINDIPFGSDFRLHIQDAFDARGGGSVPPARRLGEVCGGHAHCRIARVNGESGR